MRPPRCDVLVVGAGPAGSATACHLARAGLDVLVADRARFPRPKPCAEYLSPATVDLLAGLGALDRIDPTAGQPLQGTTVVGARGARLTGLFAAAHPAPPRPQGLALPRTVLDAALMEASRAAGARVLEETRVESLLRDGGTVAGAILRDAEGRGGEVRARLTVGADGLRSVVAKEIGGRRFGYPRRLAFVAHVRGVRGLDGCAELHVGPAGYAGLNPLGGGLANVALVVPRARARSAGGRTAEYFLDQLERLPGIRGRVPADGVVGPVLATGPFAAWSRRVVADGALLVGDAAEFFDPFTGEGVLSALRGAAIAAEVAHEALDGEAEWAVPAHRLASYARRRRRAFAGKWAIERLIGYGMLWPALFDRAVSRLARRGQGHTLVGVTGGFVPASAVLNPGFLTRMVL